MENESKFKRINNKKESGVALATTIFITVLLTTAIIALLSAAANHSKNVTDVLGETKAYYAAESGLQSTINVLRNTAITYNQADQSQTLSGANWLTYNYTATIPNRVVIDNGNGAGTYNPNVGTAYSIFVEDPDNSGDSLTFYTSGEFQSYSVSGNYTISTDKKTIYVCAAAPCDNSDGLNPPRTAYSFTDATSTTIAFTNSIAGSSPSLGSFTRTDFNGGFDIGANQIKFRIDFKLTFPRTGIRNMWGTISKNGANFSVIFQSQGYDLLGSRYILCLNNPSAACSIASYYLNTSGTSVPFYTFFKEPVEPYRLKVVSTGYGPNGAKKQLEAFVQKDFLNGYDSPAPLMMQGAGAHFSGSSAAYNINGVDNVNGVTIPAVGVTDSTSLANVQGCNCNPAPAIVTDVPDWMSTTQNLDTLIKQFRQTAINSGRYFGNNTNLTTIGDYDSHNNSLGTGITFCDGNCSVQNNVDGGGILVVTGTLSTNVWTFKGLIIITGSGGWDRQGGGNREVVGNVVIAPYNPNNLNAGFSAPYYDCQGCGSTSIDYDPISLDTAFTGTKSISNFVLGVAEK